MQATFDSDGLRHLTKALTCLSKFGDDVVIMATPETFALATTSSSMSAYGRFKHEKSFFSKYRVDLSQGETSVSGQLPTKPLLSILKHKTNEKGCEKAEFIITDGPSQSFQPERDHEEEDSPESRLIVRLHCKHGVVKTHRLPLNPASMLNSPTMADPNSESQLSVEPKMLKSLLEQFPFSKGSKTDPQLIWQFKFNEVKLRSIETSVDAKGRPQLMTDLTINPEEFDNYDMLSEHITIAFHLREFNAVITFAETSQRSITMRFTDNAEPLYMTTIGGEDPVETLFVVATTQVQSASQPNSQANQRDATPGLRANARKRPLDGDDGPQVRMADGPVHFNDRPKRPMKVVQRTDRQSMAREMNPQLAAAAPDDEPQPSWAVLSAAQQPSQGVQYQYDGDFGGAGPSNLSLPGVARARARTPPHEREPLFLPGSQLSQLPPDQRAAIIDSGLGIENMTMEEFEAMLDGEAEEVEFGEDGADEEVAWPVDDGLDFRGYSAGRQDSLELVDDIEMAPTQPGSGGKVFRPLFED